LSKIDPLLTVDLLYSGFLSLYDLQIWDGKSYAGVHWDCIGVYLSVIANSMSMAAALARWSWTIALI
jgi:hypothetical protein